MKICIVEVKNLLSILNKPWAIEPIAADYWLGIGYEVLYNGKTFASVATTNRKGTGDYRVNPKGEEDRNGSVQIIEINGPIAKYDMCFTPGAQTLQQQVRTANMDASIAAIVLVIDSPGGQVDGTENLANEIAASKKPVVAFVDGMMCSAAYWIGSAANEIMVDNANNGHNATIGSIGIMATWNDNTKEKEMKGIKTHMVYADASTDKNAIMQQANSGDYTAIKKQLNALNNTFLSAVQNNRAGKLSSKENVLTGKTYNGNQAIRYGLADRYGNFQTAVSRAYFLSKNPLKK